MHKFYVFTYPIYQYVQTCIYVQCITVIYHLLLSWICFANCFMQKKGLVQQHPLAGRMDRPLMDTLQQLVQAQQELNGLEVLCNLHDMYN